MSDDLDRLLSRQKHRYSILKALYDNFDSDESPSVNRPLMTGKDIIKAVNFPLEDASKAAEYLRQEGLISTLPVTQVSHSSQFNNCLYSITHAGLVEVEASIRNPNKETEHFAVSITQHFHGHNNQSLNQIGNQNTANSVQNINSNPEVLELLEQLDQQIERFPNAVQDVVVESLDVVKSEAYKSTPSPRLKMALSAIWNLGKDIATVANSVSAIAERSGINPDFFQ